MAHPDMTTAAIPMTTIIIARPRGIIG